MYSLRLSCQYEDVDALSAQLWEAGTVGIQETGDELIAAFESNESRSILLRQFASCAPRWEQLAAIDWVEATHEAWPGRAVGQRIFLAPAWCLEETQPGRSRLIHNPGLACGTGEHPCTQLALEAIEHRVSPGCTVVDVGTGSGLLAIAALQLGAARAIGVDPDEAALQAASENFALNGFPSPMPLAAGSADCLAPRCAGLVVANISATVLLSIAEELSNLVDADGWLILTGFAEEELEAVQSVFGRGHISALKEWRCVCVPEPALAFGRRATPAQTGRLHGETAR